MNEAIDNLRQLLDHAERAVVFTGAGISTESGIPDFRSPGGIWSQHTPIQFEDFVRNEEARREAWRRKFIIDEDIVEAAPNRGHRAVVELIRRGTAACVITQNIDGLHQRSGIDEARIIELHGNGTYAHCLDCAKRYELIPIRQAFQADGLLPLCDQCQGIIKAATISFGQSMPEAAMQWAERESLGCDLFLAIGSSLVVYPAAGFPLLAKQNGARLVILNREATKLDAHADLVLHDEIGPVLGAATAVD